MMYKDQKHETATATASGCKGFFPLVLLILLLVMQGPLYAQEFRASIIGQLSDASGAPVPGATVTAVQHNTNQTYTAKSNAAGVFSVDFILPGQFTVTVEAQGFSKKVYSSVTLKAGQKLNLNVTLSVGTVRQQVTVTASPGLLNTSTVASGGVVDLGEVQGMPSSGRQAWDMLAFAQGSRIMSPDTGNITDRNNGVLYSVNGSPQTDNAYFVNGAPVSTSAGKWDLSPSEDAVQEMQIESLGGAEDGPAAGGVFNSIIKQGTNSFHGALYDYDENAAFDTNTYVDDLTRIPKPLNIKNIFGGNVGGPVQKGKTFFFFSYEGFRQDQPVTMVDSVPTAAMGNGDFSGTPYAIYNPSTVTCTQETSSGCSTYGRTEFPNDTIPQSDISPSGAAIMRLYPSPDLAGVESNYSIPVLRTYGYNQYIGRVDHSFSDSTRLYGIFTEQGNYAFNGGNGFTNAGDTEIVPTGDDINAIFDFTRTISPSLVADVRASFGRYTTFTVDGTTIQRNYSIPGLSMPVVPTTSHLNIAPEVAVTNYTSLFGNTENGSITNYWNLSPSLDEVKGRHTLHYGFEFMDFQSGASGIPCDPNGTFSFTGQWTQANPLTATTGTGNGLADLLLGYPASGSVAWGINDFTNYHYYAAYLQDDFKALKNVTLDLGLRWEVDTSPSERHNGINGPFCFTCTNPYNAQINAANYPGLENPLTGGLTFAGVTAPRAPYNTPLTNWQPRLGIAWAITPKTVFRAGFGIYDAYASLGTSNTGFSETTPYAESLNGNVSPTNYFLSGHPYPSGIVVPLGAKGGLETDAGDGITYDSPSGAVPYSQHWSIGFQRELPKQIVMGVEYVGTHTHPVDVSQPWDVMGLTGGARQEACFQNSAVCDDLVSNPFYGVLPTTTTLGASKTLDAWELTAPYPLFDGISQANDPLGYAVYNALQVRFQRQIKSVDFVANYDYANWMEANQYLNAGDFRDANLWYGPDSLDVQHNLSGVLVWPLPVGQGGVLFRNAHGLLGGLLNHWVTDEDFEAWTGYPLAIPSANLVGGPGCTSYYPVVGQTAAHWFNNNESCYKPLSEWQARTTPISVGYLRQPPYFLLDAMLEKSFALPREGMSMTFRIESANVTNTPIFGAPNDTVSDVPTFVKNIGETGFGTLPDSTISDARYVVVSLKISF